MITKNKTGVNQKPSVRKARAKKKTITRNKSNEAERKSASASRHALVEKLNQDMTIAKETLVLARVAIKDEIALLKKQLNDARKQEKELVKIGKQKSQKMIAAAIRMEKKQASRLKKTAEKVRKKTKKK